MQEKTTRTIHKAHCKNHVLYTNKPSGKTQRKPYQRPDQGRGKGAQTGENSSPKHQGSCRWHGLPYHWERDCRKKKAGEPRQMPSPETNTAQRDKGKDREKTSPSVLMVQTLTAQRLAEAATVCLLTGRPNAELWYIDFGTFAHIRMQKRLPKNYKARTRPTHVVLGD